MSGARSVIFTQVCACVAAWFAPAALAAEPAKDQHVVVISIDGLAGYLLDDPKAPIPTIRRLAREGSFAVGGMRVSNPSVTWPNHTSMVTGVRPEKHGVLANGVLVRGAPLAPVTVDPRKDKLELCRVTTVFDVAHAAGLSTADVNWPCTRNATTLDDSFPDAPDALNFTTPRLRVELVNADILADEADATFKSGSVVGRDHVWTEVACHLIRRRQPNLLLLHLLNVDATHHSLGPQTPAGYTANAYADSCVARVLQSLDAAGIRERTTIFIVADHGFTTTPKAICPNVVLRQEQLLTMGAAGKIVEARINVVPEGGIGLVYCNDPGMVADDAKRFRELVAQREGVAEILEPSQFAAHGLPHPREYAQAPDLVLVAKDGYGVSGVVDGDSFVRTNVEGRVSLGSHGFVSSLKRMNAVCVIAGRGVRKGVQIKSAENIDVAPTVARLLGIAGFPVDGRVWDEILVK